MVAAAGPAVGSLWWLAKGGGRLLNNPWAKTALTGLGIGTYLPSVGAGIKKDVIDSQLDYVSDPDAYHDLNFLQQAMLGDFGGMFRPGQSDVEKKLSALSKNKQTAEARSKNADVRAIEAAGIDTFDLSKDPTVFVSDNYDKLQAHKLKQKIYAQTEQAKALDQLPSAVRERNIARRAREFERQQILDRNARATAEFNALLAKERALELARMEQKDDSNRLLQLQLNNDQARHMYALETNRLGQEGKKTKAVIDSLGALAGLFGI
tara:strand:+ start:288 stop:1082 length:795 start_codon:yes stop_codon:yes gene_type:complete